MNKNTSTKRQRAAIDRQVEEIVRRRCSGIAINIMDISKVFDAAYAAQASGADVESAVVSTYHALEQK